MLELFPRTAWSMREGLGGLLAVLGAGNGETRFVGGFVRDTLLLGSPTADIDCATIHPPEEVLRRAGAAGIRTVPTGIAHGTITAVLPSGPVEITTLRRDVSTDGRHAEVAFSEDWHEDAARRDFTINALSADPETGSIFDYFDGRSDLEHGVVRFIGDPLKRISEDHLRILRFFRFHARFGKADPDADGLAACTARARDLMALSRERVAGELLKLLALESPASTVGIMLDRGILAPVLPEITGRTVERLPRLIGAETEAGIGGSALRRLAAILPPDPSIAESVAVRLRLSTASRKRLAAVAACDGEMRPRELAYRIGLDAAVDCLLLAARPDEARSLIGWSVPKLPISGGALVEAGIEPGPAIAGTLKRIEDRWIEEDFPDAERVRAIARDVTRPLSTD